MTSLLIKRYCRRSREASICTPFVYNSIHICLIGAYDLITPTYKRKKRKKIRVFIAHMPYFRRSQQHTTHKSSTISIQNQTPRSIWHMARILCWLRLAVSALVCCALHSYAYLNSPRVTSGVGAKPIEILSTAAPFTPQTNI